MPRLENIERFGEILYALGSEPQLAARRPAPAADHPSPEGMTEAEPGPEEEGAEDLGLDAEGSGILEEPPALGLDDLFGEGREESAGLVEPPGELPPADDAQRAAGEADQFESEAAAGGLEDIDIADLLGGPAEEAPPPGEALEAAPAAGQANGLADGFFMPDLGLEEPAEPQAPEVAEGSELVAPPSEERSSEGLPPEEPLPEEPRSEEPALPKEPLEERAPAEAPGAEAFDPFAVDFGALEAPQEAEAGGVGAALPEEEPAGAGPSAEAVSPAEPPSEEPAFEGESFDLSDLGGEEVEAAAPAAGESTETPLDELAEGFSLEGLAEEGPAEQALPSEGAGAGAEERGQAPEGEISLEGREFRAIQRNLGALPRNLKIAIETLIGEQQYIGEGLRPLLDMLARGESAHEIAAQVSRLSGKTIRIPARFERLAGAAVEAEQRSPAYLFRTTVLPLVRTIALVVVALGLLAYGGYSFVWVPLRARALYLAGYRALEQKRYADSQTAFQKATAVRQVKGWYYRYAEGYSERSEYTLADDVYRKLEEHWGYDRKELLDRARLHSKRLANFDTAEALLGKITDRDFHDYQARLALGDNYLEWARHAPVDARRSGERTRRGLLDEAHRSYALLLDRYGYRNEILYHMMRYFVRSNQLDDAQDLRAYLEGRRDFKPDPDVYAELGGYLLDRDDVEGARTVLHAAAAESTTIPEIDYHLARLYRVTDQPVEERKALGNAIAMLGEAERTPERIAMAIDAHRRLGDLEYRQERYIDATREYRAAIRSIEKEQEAGTLGRMPELGLAYQGLGDVGYYVDGDYDAALHLYQRARWNGVDDPRLDYRVAYIRYARGEYAEAVAELVPVQERLPQNWNALFGVATALFQRQDYFAAEGYYRRLLDRLTDKRNAIANLRPEVNPEHFELVNLLVKAHNNLGVTYYMLARSRGMRGPELTRAMVEVTQAAEYLDIMARAPETLERSEAKNLAYLNASGLQHPTSRFQPSIYDRIPKDTEAHRF